MIKKHNADPKNTWWMGINQFMTLTHQEFNENYASRIDQIKVEDAPPSNVTLASPVGFADWTNTTNGTYVTPVKNGGFPNYTSACVSGYIFAAVGAYESLMWISGGSNGAVYSEQQVFDCITNISVCTGSSPQAVWSFINKSGIVLQSAAPWRGSTVRHCNITNGTNKMNSYTYKLLDCIWLRSAVDVSPAVTYTYSFNQVVFYSNGTLTCTSRTAPTLYAVWLVIVGYSNTTWTAKNSWGTTWGDQGFITFAADATTGNTTCYLCNSNLLPNLS